VSTAVSIVAFRITNDCIGCGLCKKKCPWNAIIGEKKTVHVVEPTLCRQCGTCWYSCPRCAVEDAKGYRRYKSHQARTPKSRIDREECVGCLNCLLNCEQSAIRHQKGVLTSRCAVEESRCIGCGSCLACCPGDCISLA